MKLIALSIAWVAGIYFGSLLSLSFYAFLLVFFFALFVAVLYRRRQAFLWMSLCLLALFGGIACYQWKTAEPTLHPSEHSGEVAIIGEVDRDPELQASTARLSLDARKIRSDGDWQEVSGKVLVYTQVFPGYSQGDVLELAGELHSPTRPGFSATMSYPQIEFLERGWLYGARNRLSDSLAEALSEPEASLAQAILLGDRSHVPDDLIIKFRDSGTSHLLAVSGLHVGCLAVIMLGGAAWAFGRQRPTYLIVTLATVWLYASLTGMRPPAFRAGIMFSLFLFALYLGRPRSALPSLALAAAVMVGLDPSVLWDVSFQLSFVAVTGIVLLVPYFTAIWRKRVVSRLEERTWLASSTWLVVYPLTVSLAAIIATYPLIAYYFGYVSVVGLPATFLALVALPVAILLSLVVAVLGLFTSSLALVVGWVDWLFLSYIVSVVEAFASLPFAGNQVAPVSAGWIWAYYGVFVAVLLRRRLAMIISKPVAWGRERSVNLPRFMYRPPRKWVIVPLLVAAVLVWVAVMASPDRKLEVSFLDVGQGDAILIQTPSGQQVLVDGGPDPEKICLELGDRLPFWDKSLDLVVLTHAEYDHLLGLVEVLGRYDIGLVLEPGLGRETLGYAEWRRMIDEDDIQTTVAKAGQHIDLGDGITMEVLHPQVELLEGSDSDINNNSVVLQLSWGEVSFLLTGDIFEEAEREILHNGCTLGSTVLKVAHHGSATSTCMQFLTAVGPRAAVICVGENDFGHPHGETLARLSGVEVYRTDEQGTVTFTTNGKRLWVETER